MKTDERGSQIATGFEHARISGYPAIDYCQAIAWNACEKYGREELYEDVSQDLILFAIENPSLWDADTIKGYHEQRATWDDWKPEDNTRHYQAGSVLKKEAGKIVRKMVASGVIQTASKQWAGKEILAELKSWKKTGEVHPELENALGSHRLPTDYQELLEAYYRDGTIKRLDANTKKKLQRARDRLTEIVNNPLRFDADEDAQRISNRYIVGGPGTKPSKRPNHVQAYEGTQNEGTSVYDDPSGVCGQSEDAFDALAEMPLLRSYEDFSAATEDEIVADLLGVDPELVIPELADSLRRRFDVDLDCWMFANSGKYPSASFAFAYGALSEEQQKALLVRYSQGYTSKQKRAGFLAGVEATNMLRRNLGVDVSCFAE